MEQAVTDGRVRSIGISNFESERLEELLESAVIKPSVLQVECHPYY
ncbi:MAG: aldo/keto reductase [[Clostridium] innocuum]|nr:aldo/keto reductase [Clostridium sp.]